MNWKKTGALIRRLRIGKGMTQRELACCRNLSDKTISKWELGRGSSDVSVLKQLRDSRVIIMKDLLKVKKIRKVY